MVDRHVTVSIRIRNGDIWTSSLARSLVRCESHTLKNEARTELKTLYRSKWRHLRHSFAAARVLCLSDHESSNSLSDRAVSSFRSFVRSTISCLRGTVCCLAVSWHFLLDCTSSRTCFFVSSLPAYLQTFLLRFFTLVFLRFKVSASVTHSVRVPASNIALLWHLRYWCVFKRSRQRCFSGKVRSSQCCSTFRRKQAALRDAAIFPSCCLCRR